ncbi:hypothetical protein [Sandarakinorhabdus sp.]|uniref:hypothetical protein n=1 Tax=Sandarakinorhabdus sp. TaxID=1916663 RepID=UPI003F701309
MAGFRLKYPMADVPAPWHLAGQELAQVDFRMARLAPATGVLARLFGAVLGFGLRLLLQVARLLGRWNVPFLGVEIFTRDANVTAVLGDPASYPVPFGAEMRLLAHGPPGLNDDPALRPAFMLGTEGEDHASQRALVLAAMQKGPAWKARFEADTTAITAALVANCDGQIDVMRDVFARVTAQTGADWLGLSPRDIDAYSDWTLAMSAMLFGDPVGNATTRELAQHGGWRLRALIDGQIGACVAQLAPLTSDQRDAVAAQRGLIWALVATKMAGAISITAPDHALIRAIITGLAIGLGPTTTLAGGKAFDWLLRHPAAWDQAVKAAGDRDALRRIALEASRMAPALDPGQFRMGPDGVVLAATAIAMRDGRKWPDPGSFNPDRWIGIEHAPNLMFGYCIHDCIGQHMAVEQMTSLFAVLFALPGLAHAPGAAGKLQMAGPFPFRLEMRFGAAQPAGPAAHSMITLNVPVLQHVPPADVPARLTALEDALLALGNPAGPAVRAWLDAAAIVHFLSINALDVGSPETPDVRLLIEISADGPPEAALDRIFASPPPELAAPLAQVSFWDGVSPLPAFLNRHRLDVRPRAWGTTGLLYDGSPGFTMATKRQRDRLAAFARAALDDWQQISGGTAQPPLAALNHVRGMLAGTLPPPPHLAAAAAELRPMLFVPGRQRLNFVDFRFPGLWSGLFAYLATPAGRWIPFTALVPVGVFTALAWAALGGGLWPGRLLLALAAGIIGGFGLWLGLALYAYASLRRLETADVPDTRDPDLLRRLRITSRENPRDHEQSHIISASDFKPGWLRRLTFAFAMWGIGVFARHYTRPGFILTMGTIHFARWFRLPDAEKLIFFSNYDGSWESYLEDFITKAHPGQTAAWSHGIGFPPTVGLIGEGAANGDLFKRWVRRQQQLTGCWYSALPHLTLDRIRAQALIHHGLARAHDAASARDWLDLLGALPRPASIVDTSQVQALVFRSLGSLAHGAHIFLNFPDAGPGTALARIIAGEGALPPVIFGDLPSGTPHLTAASAIALSPAGLQRLGLPGPDSAQGLASFPLAFMAGMGARADILGDTGTWMPPGSAAGLAAYDRCDAVLMLAAATPEHVADAIAALAGIATIQETVITSPTTTAPDGQPGLDHDHFGFRDGISQPAIRGAGDWRQRDARDQLAPGEFLLGHPASAGYTAPPLRLASELDPAGLLPATAEPARPYPDFQASSSYRDFGRNGSFVVVRRLKQDVAGFHAGAAASANDLTARCPHLPAALQQNIDGPWLQARMIGRWPDGTPTIDRAGPQGRTDARNDFSFAAEDPQGLACPLGAHIRRANPRDGLDPSDPTGWDIANRHRIIRRGRPYDTGSEKGLMFTAICADIERQFEFVQQRWLFGRSFHGLPGEIDPLLGQGDFTLPTHLGPVRVQGLARWVETLGGGYFFLPGRAALQWLIQARG